MPQRINFCTDSASNQGFLKKKGLTSPFFAVPAPRQLTLERQLNKSILIGWTSPDCPPGQIEMYHVYVDGFLRTTVRATDKTKALVEGVDNARVSYDAQCSKIRKKLQKYKNTFFAISKMSKKSIFAPEKSPKIAFLVVLTCVLYNRHPFSNNGIFPNFIEQKT